jgi:hypothetical protein
MEQTTEFVQQNKSILSTIAFLAVMIGILYAVYVYMFPGANPTHTMFLKGAADARKPVPIKGDVPTIYTGGDFTLSFWIYIDDFNYLASRSKFLFALSPKTVNLNTVSPLVGALTPMTNGLMIRAHTAKTQSAPPPGTAANPINPGSGAGPDITQEAVLQQLMSQQTSMNMFQSTVDTPCDIKDVPIQRWVNITIVSSGRVLDVYVDGKLQRSCVLENVIHVPRQPLHLRLGENGGFGGRYSHIQMWSTQLTPAAIYGVYQLGPNPVSQNIFAGIASLLNLDVTFTGSAPGQPVSSTVPSNPFAAMGSSAQSAYSSLSSDVQSAYSSVTAEGQSIMSRF